MLWLVGQKGMLGTEVASILERGRIPYVGTDVELDITSYDAVRDFVAEHRPAWIVNCAAYTAVDQAEDEEDLAFAVNANGPENLARAAAELASPAASACGPATKTSAPAANPSAPRIIHISTDYVFPGDATAPIPESAAPAPQSAYGRTKAAGEARLTAANPAHFIVRTAWLYGPAGKNFVATMLRLMGERDELTVVSDQRGTPTYAADLAEALVRLVQSDSRDYGAYHYTNAGEATWYDFAVAIRDEALARGMIERRIPILPVTTAEYPTKAERPAYSVLSLERFAAVTGVEIPPWREALGRYLDRARREST